MMRWMYRRRLILPCFRLIEEKKYVFTGEVIDATYYGQPVSFSIAYPTTMAKEDVPVGMGIISDATDISIVSSKAKVGGITLS
jgi:hypothetical protein